MNMRPDEAVALVATVDPQTIANSEQVTDWVDMSKFHQIMFVLLLGNMASETIDFKLEQATDSAGAGKKDVTGKTATQLAASATVNDNSQVMIVARAEELDSDNDFRFVRGRAITGGATGGAGAVLGLAFDPKYRPGNADNLASVKEVKS